MLSATALLASAAPAFAQTAPSLPSGGVFVAGEGTIQTAPNSMTITQSSNRGVIDWREFSIGTEHKVQIDNATGATLNRVMGGQLSRIEGALSATGSVYLMNPAGVIVGPGGKVMTGGDYIATTGAIDKGAFMAGGALAITGATGASITNQGSVVSQTGSVMMIARSVSNSGTIKAAKGRVALAAATDVLLATTDGRADNIYVSVGADGGDITQTGRIEAAAVALKAANGNIFALAGNRDGLVQATGTATIDGELWLTAPKGNVTLEGEFAAANADGSGGRIVATGKTIDVAATARVDATGARGGEILIGADAYGAGTGIAERTTIAAGATITAGGVEGGGRIETSGKAFVLGNAEVTAGRGGKWLIDPDDILIDTAAASTIVTSLDAGTDVTQQTTSSGTGGVGDITVAAPIVWTGTGDLTLDAFRNIAVNETISGGGNVNLFAQGEVSIGAPVSGAQMFARTVGTVSIGAAGSFGGTGTVGIESGTFVNQGGSGAVSSSGGDWLIASNDPANDSDGGLLPDYYGYDYDNISAVPAPGNGRFYRVAPSVTISLGSVTKSYDGTTTAILDDSNTTVTGLIAGDDWTLDGTYATKDVGTGINVTADNFEATRGGIPVFGYATNAPVTAATGTITAAVLTAAIIGNPTKTYNASTAVALTSANFGLTGVAAGESITVTAAASSAYDSADAGSRTVDATFTSTNFAAGAGTSLSNYVLPTSATGAGLINPASILISGVTANDKVYDGNTIAGLNTGSATIFGVIGGDAVSLDASGAAGVFATENVGTAIAVTGTGFGLIGADAANYVVSQPTGLAANITPAPLVVTGLTANDKVYDGTTTGAVNTAGLVISGNLVPGDDITPVAGAGAQINFATKNVGQDIAVTVSGVTLAGADAGNYDFSFGDSLVADITPRPLTISSSAYPTKVYDGTAAAFISPADVALGNLVAGESISITQAASTLYASKNVGVWSIDATLSPSDYQAGANTLLSNYTLPTALSIMGEITPAPLTISIVGNPTKTYDGNANATLGPSNFEVTGFVVGEGATVTETQGQYSSADAGTRTVTVDLDANDFDPDDGTLMSNYFIPSPVYGPGTIVRRDIGPGVVYVDITGNPTRVYDGTVIATLDPSDYTLSGFIPGEGATITETVGQYDLKDAGQRTVLVLLDPSDFAPDPGTNLNNYNLPDQATGIGTILRAPLTATIIGNPTKVYNGTAFANVTPANYSISGLVGSESVTIAPGVPALYTSVTAGNHPVVALLTADSEFVFSSGALRANYELPTFAQGPGTITPAPLVVLGVGAQNKVYDQTTLATLTGSASLFGVVSGDTVVLEGGSASGTFATPNVGNGIAVTVAGYGISGEDAGNYQLFQPSGISANITPRGLVIANVSALDKLYDGTTAATLDLASASLTGVLSGDDVALDATGTTAAFLQKNIGVDLRVNAGGFALSGTDAGNYSLSQPSGLTADINPVQLSGAILGNPTKTYDTTTAVSLGQANYALTGFVAGEGGTVTQSAGASYDSPNAGARTITATLVVSDIVPNAGTLLSNYLLPASISGPGTITQAQLTAAIIGNPTKVYDSTTAATLASGNYALSGFLGSDGATVTEIVGTYDSKNVGNRTVTASLDAGDFAATGSTMLGNYVLPTSASGAGTITQADVQVIGIVALDKIYDGTTVAGLNSAGGGLSGVFAGDTVTLVTGGASGTFATKNVGTDIPVTATGYTTTGADAGNYRVLQPVGLAADITQATISLASVTKVYDAFTTAPTANSAYALSGVFGSDDVSVNASGITGNYDNKNVGTGKGITLAGVALAGADASNYLISPTTTNAPIGIITPAQLNIIGVAALDKVYDQSSTATLDNTSTALQGVLTGSLGTDDVSLVLPLPTTGNFVDGSGNPTANAGTWTVSATGYAVTGADATNYALVQPQGVTATITRRPITLTSVVKVYDGGLTLPTDPAGYGFSGILSGDAVTADASAATGGYATKDVAGSISGGVVTGGINVDVSGLTLSGPQGNNYSVADVTASPIGVITPRLLTASIIGTPTKTYDATNAATLTPANFQLNGFVLSEGATVTQTAGTYDSINAGPRTVTASLASGDFTADSGTLLSNYTLPTSASGAGLINQAVLTISGVVALNKVYDGNTIAQLAPGGVLNGIVAGEPNTITLNESGRAGQFAQASVGTNIPVTASGYAIDGDVNNNYILTQPTGLSADITQALLTITRITRIYNGLLVLPADSAAYTLGGVVAGDQVFVEPAGITGSYASKDVATGINVNATGISLGGAAAGNYSIASTLVAAPVGEITPATLTAAVINNPTKTYDGNNIATLNSANYLLTGFVAGEGATVTETSGTYDSLNAGARTVNVGLLSNDFTADPGTLLSNYILPTSATGAGTIERANLVALIVNNPTKTYDGNVAATLASLNFQLNGFVAGEGATVTQTAGTYASPNAGSRLVTASLAAGDFTANSGTLLDNYNLPTNATGLGTIDPRALTAAIIGNPTKIYDGNTVATLTSANFQLTGFVTGEGATVTETVGAYDDPNAGTRTVSATLDSGDFTATGSTLLSNYVLPTSASGAGTIGQKALTAVIVGNPTKPYDGTTAATLAAVNYLLTGFVGSEGATVTQTAGTYASPNAGARLITAILAGGDFIAGGGTNLANYVLPTQAQGMGTIGRLALSASIIGNPTKIYDGTTAATLASGNYQLSGFIAGEDATVTETVGSYDSKNAGPRTVTATLDSADFTANSGTLLDNYILPTSASGAGTISQKLLTALIIGLPTKVYDATTAATLASTNFALTGFVAGEGATVTETAGTYGSPDAGIRIVTAALDGGDFSANGGTLLSNYVLPTSATGAGIIEKATLNAIIIGNPTKTYDATTGATLTSANYLLTGFVGGQGATITETVGAYNSPNAGARIVTAMLGSADFVANGGTDLRNYALPLSATGAGTIDPRALTAAIIGNPTKTYDGTTVATLASGNFALSGFVAGEGAIVTESVGAYDNRNAGPRTVSATLDGGDFAAAGSTLLSNYVLPTSASGAGTISQAQLTAAIIGNPTKTYDGTTGATLASANFQLSGFLAGEGATVTETLGSYGSPNAGIRTVTAVLDGGDFTANAGTLLSNYVLPTSANGLGTISQAMLSAAIIGNPTKTYDGTTGATLGSANYQLSGFIAGEGATVTEIVGSYGSPNAGIRAVTAVLDGGDFTADAGTLLSNYVFPTSASGLGTIDQAVLTAAIIGNPTKTYDGTTGATLGSANYQLSGFVAGEGATVTETMGSYGSPNAGIHTVSATLDGGDFTADAGTLLSNYVLPTSAGGLGTIDRAVLAAAIIGNPTKTYDGATGATLGSANYQLSGFVAGEGATVTQTAGVYDEKNAGSRIVTATLAESDFAAGAGTLLSNYVLPASAAGAGTIDPKELTVAILGTPTKVYDGTTAAALSTDDFRIFGFVAGEGVAVGSTISGTYAGKDVGLHALTIDPASANITPDAGTLLSNYVLRTGANGIGRITPAPLAATLADVFKIYDGNTAATLAPANFTLTGFVAGEGATVTQTAGVYDDPNAGSRTVTAALAAGDFVANGGTLLSNYILPATAVGTGSIGQALLTAAIIGNPTKVYDGTTAALLGSANYQLTGFVAGEGATVNQAAGLYDSANAGARTVTANLAAGDFTANGGTLLSNYVLPTSASGMGTISQALLTAAIIGNPTKTYDGNTATVLASTNFALTGFVAGEGATVTQTTGTYDNKNAGSRAVSASLAAGDFTAATGTLLSNYVLPTSATGAGTIDRADLTVAITGRPTKDYDGNTDATLTSTDYTITGFVAGEGATITETSGTYASPDPGEQLVTAILAADDYAADAGTLLSNYNLPTQAVGEGEIIATAPPPCSDGLLDCLPPNLAFRLAVTSRQHFYIPFPTLYPMYQGATGAFAGMPSIITYPSVIETSGGMLIATGSTLINSGDQILNRMGGSRTIRIEYPPLRPIDYEGLRP